MSLRDPEFLQSFENFLTTSTLYIEKQLPESQVSWRTLDESVPSDRHSSECALPSCSKRPPCALIYA